MLLPGWAGSEGGSPAPALGGSGATVVLRPVPHSADEHPRSSAYSQAPPVYIPAGMGTFTQTARAWLLAQARPAGEHR